MSATEPALPGGPLDAAFRDGRRQRLRPGAVLFSEGDVSNRVVLLLSGRVKVSSFSEDGQETVLGFRGAGDVLGELSAIDGEEHRATVTVVEAGEAMVVPAERFLAALETMPGLALVLLRSIVGRLRDADRKRAEFTALTWWGGSPTAWWSWPDDYGEPGEDGIRIGLADLPARAGGLGGLVARGREQGGPAAAAPGVHRRRAAADHGPRPGGPAGAGQLGLGGQSRAATRRSTVSTVTAAGQRPPCGRVARPGDGAGRASPPLACPGVRHGPRC